MRLGSDKDHFILFVMIIFLFFLISVVGVNFYTRIMGIEDKIGKTNEILKDFKRKLEDMGGK